MYLGWLSSVINWIVGGGKCTNLFDAGRRGFMVYVCIHVDIYVNAPLDIIEGKTSLPQRYSTIPVHWYSI